jgi:hypothetical protein
MSRNILIADLLCGAGGSSTGAIKALVGLWVAPADIVGAAPKRRAAGEFREAAE